MGASILYLSICFVQTFHRGNFLYLLHFRPPGRVRPRAGYHLYCWGGFAPLPQTPPFCLNSQPASGGL